MSLAVLAACAGRLIADRRGRHRVLLLLVALVSLAAGGVYQQRFCADVDFRATAALQNAVALLPVAVLALVDAVHGARPVEGGGAVAGRRAAQRDLGMSLYVRAINTTAPPRWRCCSASSPPSRACCPG